MKERGEGKVTAAMAAAALAASLAAAVLVLVLVDAVRRMGAECRALGSGAAPAALKCTAAASPSLWCKGSDVAVALPPRRRHRPAGEEDGVS